jgi:leucyl-tRNA synthetase
MKGFDFGKIEKKWQNRWEKGKIFNAKKSKKSKFYVLEMFPYPSGAGLHMGHALNYTIGDIFSRFKRLNDFNVLHPMGYDALGLPAENAAIKAGTHPEKYTNNSIENFMKQQKALGLSYDWSRLINTASPDYYKWDQWIFLKMLEKGLAYQKESAVNWCPKCNTVLANEQVHDGNCWRHGDTAVVVKQLKQWFFKTTEYADELFERIDDLDWPSRTKAMQKNWIGKSHGTEIDFKIGKDKWPIFTTRPDTLFGVTFMVVSAQHSQLNDLVTDEQKKEVDEFLKKLGSVSEKELGDMEKEGVFTGSYAVNPINDEEVPVYAGNFVLADYGSGMVMAVPAHDQRDFEFAKKYDIEIKQVIGGKITKERAHTGGGELINSGEFNGLDSKKAKEEITKFLSKKKYGKKVINFKLRDWGISRQRYWGTPIPIVYCKKCGVVPVPEKDLPVKLPKDVKFGKGNPLETNKQWLDIDCPKCGDLGRRESDTMDTFVNSSWYFMRYCDPNNDKKIFDSAKTDYWCPVDQYIGGAEHACMHLIYFRFYTKFLRDLGLINFDEPAIKLFHQGMLHGEDGNKMSKSLGNTIDPLDTIAKYGVGAVRMFLVSVATPDKDFNWSEKGIQGSFRTINKIMTSFSSIRIGKDNARILNKLNKSIEGITRDIEGFKYNLAVIKIRQLFDAIDKEDQVSKKTLEKFLIMLSPFCPHITEELWEGLGNKPFICNAKWPEVEKAKIDESFDRDEAAIDQLREDIGHVKKLVNKANATVYIYVLPNEVDIYKDVGGITLFAVNDPKKHDPEGKAKKAKPGKPAIYLE